MSILNDHVTRSLKTAQHQRHLPLLSPERSWEFSLAQRKRGSETTFLQIKAFLKLTQFRWRDQRQGQAEDKEEKLNHSSSDTSTMTQTKQKKIPKQTNKRQSPLAAWAGDDTFKNPVPAACDPTLRSSA